MTTDTKLLLLLHFLLVDGGYVHVEAFILYIYWHLSVFLNYEFTAIVPIVLNCKLYYSAHFHIVTSFTENGMQISYHFIWILTWSITQEFYISQPTQLPKGMYPSAHYMSLYVHTRKQFFSDSLVSTFGI